MAKKYLDLKADVTYKKVLGEHKNMIDAVRGGIAPTRPVGPRWYFCFFK